MQPGANALGEVRDTDSANQADKQGNLVLDPTFTTADDFSEGLAVVADGF